MAGFNIKDIAGFGEIFGHIKDLLLKIIEIVSTRAERKLMNENLKLENTRKLLNIAKEHNLTPEQLKYYESLANETPSNLIHIDTYSIETIESQSESRAFSPKLSETQSLSDSCGKETKDSFH